MLVLFAMSRSLTFSRFSRPFCWPSRSAAPPGRRRRRPKSPPSPRASMPRRRPSPTARSRTDSSRPPSAPNIIWPAGSTASGNTTCRCGCSPTAIAPTARRSWQRSSPTSGRRSGISTSPWPTAATAPMWSSSWCATATSIAPSRPSTAANAPGEIRTSLDPQCLSGFPQERKIRDRALRRHPHRRQWRLHLPGLRL